MDILTIVLKVLLLSVAIFIVAKILPKVTIKNFGAALKVFDIRPMGIEDAIRRADQLRSLRRREKGIVE